MVAEAKDQTAVSSQDASAVVTSEFRALPSDKTGYAPKVRKPYTITKQRERWSEDEHQRFVEALKLYGRAWRQIEEHVGTKTAIQIRSHAQKFFAKVTRDSCLDSEGSLYPIEIPPPRPKKKPLHPYPRKTVDSVNIKGLADVAVVKRENYSPTSVFSAIGSDNLESNVADVHKSRLSPASCATDALSANLFTENDNEASNVSSKDEHGFHLSVKMSSASVLDNKSTTKFELFPRETESTLDSPCTVEPYASIKLFGKTVVVRDPPKQSLEVVESSESLSGGVVSVKHESNSNNLDSQVVLGFVSDNTTPSHLPNVYYHTDNNVLSLPWLTWFNGPIYPSLSSCERTRAGSLVGSNSGSTGGGNSENRNSDVAESQHRSDESRKGFLPYKRCLAQRDEKSSMSFLQGREGQRAPVCS